MGGLQYDDPLLCICSIVIAFDRKLNFLLYSEKAWYFKGLYLYKDKLLCTKDVVATSRNNFAKLPKEFSSESIHRWL